MVNTLTRKEILWTVSASTNRFLLDLKVVHQQSSIMKSTIRFLLPFLIFIAFIKTSLAQTDDFQLIKERVVAELMKTPVEDNEVKTILDNMNEDGSFKDINYADLSRTAGFPHRRHTYDLVHLAKAYKTKTSSFYKSEKLIKRIRNLLINFIESHFLE